MSLAIAHFAIGFGSTVLVWTFLRKSNTNYMLPTFLGGAIWAMMPDLHNVMPVFQETYREIIHDSIVANLFWFHRVFDIADPQDTHTAAALALMYLCGCIAFRELYLYSQKNSLPLTN